jgi:glycosidase
MIIYELNARVYGKKFNEISDEELQKLVDLGFDWLWLMGIWRTSPKAKEIFQKITPDFEASPYALLDYKVNPDLGGEEALSNLVNRAHKLGLKVMADFVPNHMAPDSPLIDEHPEFFIHSNKDLRDELDRDYFTHPSGKRLAYGRDPYFAGWPDTAQLDYTHPELRAYQINELKRLATLVDGLRCDMAMLVLKEQIKNQWFPRVDWDTFNHYMPNEFWSEAITAVKGVNKHFIFMAEVYWDKEPYLQELGFDLTYDKKLYDLIEHSNLQGLVNYLVSTPNYYLSRSVHFLENHDEERAAQRFGNRQRPAAILSYGILGVPFVHQGQMQGFKEKLPVQRIKPLTQETPDLQLEKFYQQLLYCVKDPIFRVGEMITLGAQAEVILVRRRHEGRTILVGADITKAPGSSGSPALTIPLMHLKLSPSSQIRCLDHWTGQTVELVRNENGNLYIPPAAIASWPETGGFLLEIFAS